jgi:hypothetical protein
VVDISKPSIVADSLLLFQSLRLFGGESLNRATFLACIVVDPKHSLADDPLLRRFLALGVQLDFVRQVNAPFARTINKFSAFYRAGAAAWTSRFDHFLWLDADVLVLGDPLPRLPARLQPGSIYCVPEVKSLPPSLPPSLPRWLLSSTPCTH